MTNVREIRVAQLRVALREFHNNQSKLAERLGKSPAQVSQWLSGYRTINEDSARGIERKLHKPAGWLDTPSDAVPPPAQASEPAAPFNVRPPWPFKALDESAVCALPETDILRIESWLLLLMAQTGMETKRRSA